MRRILVPVLALAAAVASTASAVVVSAAPLAPARDGLVSLHRGGPDRTVVFHRARSGEVFMSVTVSARGVSWAEKKNESAVVSAYVDGHYATDIVIMSSSPVRRQLALGHLGKGQHTLRLHYATQRSRSRAGVASLRHLGFRTVAPSSPAYAAARYAPVLYGRAIASLGGRFQNNRTDTPLVAWHQVLPAAAPGHSVIEYSVIWSNEDGGTSTPALMAQWGRTTDIEWVYRVEVDARGRRVAGSGVIQAANHVTKKFRGRYDGTHPLIQTCTSNNNVCDKVTDPMRFALSTRRVLPASQPREHEMDIQPWTYQVMAREMVRERGTADIGDQRRYLYIALTHDTTPPASASDVGLVVDVKLVGGSTIHSSIPDGLTGLALLRDGPAATTVKLPRGTTAADIESISARRVEFNPDSAPLSVTALDRAFFLRRNYLPRPSFASWHSSTPIELTPGDPSAVIWPVT